MNQRDKLTIRIATSLSSIPASKPGNGLCSRERINKHKCFPLTILETVSFSLVILRLLLLCQTNKWGLKSRDRKGADKSSQQKKTLSISFNPSFVLDEAIAAQRKLTSASKIKFSYCKQFCMVVALLGMIIVGHGCHRGGHDEADLEPVFVPSIQKGEEK